MPDSLTSYDVFLWGALPAALILVIAFSAYAARRAWVTWHTYDAALALVDTHLAALDARFLTTTELLEGLEEPARRLNEATARLQEDTSTLQTLADSVAAGPGQVHDAIAELLVAGVPEADAPRTAP